jgi:hypothetical protein
MLKELVALVAADVKSRFRPTEINCSFDFTALMGRGKINSGLFSISLVEYRHLKLLLLPVLVLLVLLALLLLLVLVLLVLELIYY